MARKSRRRNIEEVVLKEAVFSEISREVPKLETAAYARLSVDKGEDEKIETQIEMLHQYIEGRTDLVLADTYVDNGYSGTNFDRPEFNRLMDDVRTGKIHCIVVKDLSRFGRDFIETGYYLETLLPNLNVRFISINDDYDSNRMSDRNSIAVPIKNIVNELYAKDASKKQTVYFEMCSKNGTRKIERSTFGYSIDRDNNVLVVNPVTAPYVQLIFRWFLIGHSTGEIVKRLTLLGIRTPLYYKSVEEGTPLPDTDRWTTDRVKTILENRTYAGDTVYGKRRKVLYKNVNTYHAKREDWVIHENTHEALVAREDFDKVQQIFGLKRKKIQKERAALKDQREKYTDYFPQKVCCMECGKTMLYSRYSRSRYSEELNGAVYWCHNTAGKKECGQKIHEDYLRIIVMDQIRNLIAAVCDKKKMLKRMQTGEYSVGEVVALRRKIADLSAKLAGCVDMRESLYEDLKEGVIDEDDYRMLKEHYLSKEQKLKEEIDVAEDKKRETNRKIKQCLELVEHLEEYVGRQELDETLSSELVDKILVSSAGRIEVRFSFGDVFEELVQLTNDVSD